MPRTLRDRRISAGVAARFCPFHAYYVLGFRNAAGHDGFVMAIPTNPVFLDFELPIQGTASDSHGSLPPRIALSNALRARVGS